MTTMRISQLAERSGIPATTLRFYEGAGLLRAGRSEGGYRLYGEEAVRRLAFISAGKRLGLPLEEIGELLAVWESGACAQVKAELRPRIARRLDEAGQRAAEVAAFAATLRGALGHLDALPDRAEPCGPWCEFLVSAAPPASTAPGAEARGTVTDVQLFADEQAAQAGAERWRTAPLACTLAGDAIPERAARWRAVLDGAVRVAIPDGLRLTVPVGRAAAIAGLAADEQHCCAFFDFRLHLDGPNLHLEVRAPEAGAGMLTELFAAVA